MMALRRSCLALVLIVLISCGGDSSGPSNPGGDPEPSSYDLIDQDLRNGVINAETALLQKIFAAREDERLSRRYRNGVRSNQPAQLPLLLRRAAVEVSGFSRAGQRALVGLFQPPAYQQSGWSTPYDTIAHGDAASLRAEDPVPGPEPLPQQGWRFVDATAIPVRVWIQTDNTTARMTPEQVISLLESDIYPKLVALMGRDPVPDAGGRTMTMEDGSTLRWGDGGDGRFDIYMISISGRGHGGAMVINYPSTCSEAPSFMLLDPNRNAERLGPVLAHEFFHALQFAFPRRTPCDAPWDEATAEWASHYVYPRWDPSPWPGLLQFAEQSIIGMAYEGWLFNAYLQHAIAPDRIRETYRNYAQFDEVPQAIDAALDGGLRQHWGDFAQEAWNEHPTDRSFVNWEAMAQVPLRKYDAPDEAGNWYRPLTPDTFELAAGQAKRTWETSNPPGALTRKYRIWGVKDDNVRWLRFTNRAVGRNVRVIAWLKLRDQGWIREEWTQLPQVQFCRDFASERVDSVITMMADHSLSEAAWRETPRSEWEVRRVCPTVVNMTITDRVVNDSHGEVYNVHYAAWLSDEKQAGDADLVGVGAYTGKIITRKVNCHNGEPENVQTWPVDGLLDATGFIGADPGGPEGARLFGFVLETVDWRFLPVLGRYAQSPEEIEMARGLGTVGSGLKPVKLPGNSARTLDTLTRAWNSCTGNEFRIRDTFVQLTTAQPSARR